MDCNAQFTEIFQKTVFCDFVNEIDACAGISSELISLFTCEASCTDCDKSSKAENEVFLNYISLSDLIAQSVTPELWFDYYKKQQFNHIVLPKV